MPDEPTVETVWGERMSEKAFDRLLRLIFQGLDVTDDGATGTSDDDRAVPGASVRADIPGGRTA